MNLFVRESGPVGAPAVVFLHGGTMSGWSWESVVQRMQGYYCLVPDLNGFGKSSQQGPFEMDRAADAVAELIRSRVGSSRAHVVGLSLGAQVGMQLVVTEPKLVDRAVLCGTVINTMPGVELMQHLVMPLARTAWFRRAIRRRWSAFDAGIPVGRLDDYRHDVSLITGAQFAHIVAASARFTLPESLDKLDTPTLFLTGGKETRLAHRSAAALSQPMPNGIARVASGMRHDWPLRYPDLFSRTVDGWLSGTALPREIVQAGSRSGRPAAR
jgi:pimeloyl-ACP methyl ester carboxylesterase